VVEPTVEPSGPPTTPLERPAWTDMPVALAAEDELLAAARARAADRGVGAVGPSTAAVWTFLAAATGARTAVEIGTGVGVGTLALLRGMPSEGLLTSIDVDAEHQRLTRAASIEAGFGSGRLRLITGRALEVLPRLSDSAYDLVVIDAVTVEYPAHLTEALRLLRPGGVVALDRVLGAASVSDPVRRDAASAALRETIRLVRDDERLAPMMLPVGDGVLCAARR
jgi:predicted O-methyltransferase YrrM